jgi:hypothetical protein
MKKAILFIVVALVVTLAVVLGRSHFRQNRVLGTWNAPMGASAQFSSDGTATIHASTADLARSPSDPPMISGHYKLLDDSHMQITLPGFGPIPATFSVSGDTLTLALADKEAKAYTRVSH